MRLGVLFSVIFSLLHAKQALGSSAESSSDLAHPVDQLVQGMQTHFPTFLPYFDFFADELFMYLQECHHSMAVEDGLYYGQLCDFVLTQRLPSWYNLVCSTRNGTESMHCDAIKHMGGPAVHPLALLRGHAEHLLEKVVLKSQDFLVMIPFDHQTDILEACRLYIRHSRDLRHISSFLLLDSFHVEDLLDTLLKTHRQQLRDLYQLEYDQAALASQHIGPISFMDKIGHEIQEQSEYSLTLKQQKALMHSCIDARRRELCPRLEGRRFCHEQTPKIYGYSKFVYRLLATAYYEMISSHMLPIRGFIQMYRREIEYQFFHDFTEGASPKNTQSLLKVMTDILMDHLDAYYELYGASEFLARPSEHAVAAAANRVAKKLKPQTTRMFASVPFFMLVFRKYTEATSSDHVIHLLFSEGLILQCKEDLLLYLYLHERLVQHFPFLLDLRKETVAWMSLDAYLSTVISKYNEAGDVVLEDQKELSRLLIATLSSGLGDVVREIDQAVSDRYYRRFVDRLAALRAEFSAPGFLAQPLSIILEAFDRMHHIIH